MCFRTRINPITAFCVSLLLAIIGIDSRASGAGRPNILFILADDLSWSDPGCYGNKFFETPHLDRLATEGMRFTQAYAPAPICSASRAAILTGKTPARLGFEFVTKPEAGFQPVKTPLRAPLFTLDLPLEEVTIAETLSRAGYQTAFFGKWHLNRHYQRYLGWSPTHGPRAQGFEIAEEDFGSHPYSYWSDKTKREFLPLADGEFPEDSMTARAIAFLEQPQEKPFFLMVSHFFVHTPVHTRLQWLHDRTLARIPSDHPRRKKLAHYGAMVATLDHHVGKLMTALDDSGLTKNTLVVFTSDNGGHPEFCGNSPLRGSKWNLYEGGIRVPFLARWPEKIEPGSACETPISGIDLFPTFAELGEARKLPGFDGISLRSLLENPDKASQSRQFIWHFPYYHPETGFDKAPPVIGIDDGVTSQTRPHSVIRSGDWKLIHFFEDGRNELFHLPSDIAEAQDRSQGNPEMARKLRRQLDAQLENAKARLPVPNPDWTGR